MTGMKRFLFTLAVLGLSTNIFAQDTELRTSTSLEADWKLRKRMHLTAAYELRTNDRLKGVERNQLSTGLTYKCNNTFRVGIGYHYIGHYDKECSLKPRHRVAADLQATLYGGFWQFSLKERLQLTHATYDLNPYQQTRNLVALKSRLKVAYTKPIHWKPYASAELRCVLNAPHGSATYDDTSGTYTDYVFHGHNDVYMNRVRLTIGTTWKLTRQHAIDLQAMADWCHDRDIDTNKQGTRLKSMEWHDSWCLWLATAYKFSF